jgi:hypothetical protein
VAFAVACAGVFAGAAHAAPDGRPPPLRSDGVVRPGVDPSVYLTRPGDSVRLSNETTLTRWTVAAHRAPIRRRPRRGAREVDRLRFLGGSNAFAVYGLLLARADHRGRVWMKLRIPGRPNGRVGWVRAVAVLDPQIVRRQLVVDTGTLRAALYRRGRKIWSAPVGVGTASTPTPRGHFFLEREEGAIFGPAYGPNIFFTTAFSNLPSWPGGGVVGMHGTNQPQLVPGRPSHGCIRLHNADAARLARLARVGTPLLIR